MQKRGRFGIVKKEWIESLANLSKEEGEELLERFRYKLHDQKNEILEQVFNEGILTKKEYESKYKNMFYDELGFDGFLQYIDGVMNAESDYYVTLNKNLIKRRKELEKKFKLKIITLEELERMQVEKENKNL